MDSIVAIRKPKGPTSHDIVDAVRRITRERRVGHAGTLDPMAEGVLVIGIGREATKRLADVVRGEKEYIATVQLGATSTTDDAEGEISESVSRESVSREDIERALTQFIGHIQQVPPVYSAVKVRGKPAHRRVRKGEEVRLAAREVEIRELTLLEFQISNFKFQIRIVCGPGVYIRALARDLGAALGVGGYLAALTRTRVGQYTIDDAMTVEEFGRKWGATHTNPLSQRGLSP